MAKLTPEALRAARALLNWSMRDLAAAAGLSFSTIAKIESGTVPRDATASAIVQALARHNVEIINGDGTGARLRFQKR